MSLHLAAALSTEQRLANASIRTRPSQTHSPLVLPIKQKIYNVTSTYLSGRRFSRRDLVLLLLDRHYPGTNHDSILPSDYLCKDALKRDPSNIGNKYNFMTCPRFLERLERDTYLFVGWDGIEKGALEAPVLRSPNAAVVQPYLSTVKPNTVPQPPVVVMAPRVPQPRPISGGTDLARLLDHLRKLAPAVRKSSDRVRVAAVRVLDCVLSLNRRYDGFVVPRLDRFASRYPAVRAVTDLQRLIRTYPSPATFVDRTLAYDDVARADIDRGR